MGKGLKRANPSSAPESAGEYPDVLQLLHGDMSQDAFLKEYWGKKPHLFSSTTSRKAAFSSLLSSASQLVELAKEAPQMLYDTDVALAPPSDSEGLVDADEIKEMLGGDEAAAQIIQPQRFHDGFWRLVAMLEASLGCLVSCTACIHTTGSPDKGELHVIHSDTWICQTQGSRLWKQVLDDEDDEEEVGEGIKNKSKPQTTALEYNLKAGDVLYLPRGYSFADIHSEASCFFTLTCPPDWNWAQLALHMIKAGSSIEETAEPIKLPPALTANLPPGFIHNLGLAASLAPPSKGPQGEDTYATHERSAASALAAGLRALADSLAAEPDTLLPPALDALAEDYVRKRLPPHPSQLKDAGPEPTLDDALVPRGNGLFMVVPVDGPADPDAPEGFVVVTTPLYNERETHMMEDEEEEKGGDDHDSDEEEGDDLDQELGALLGKDDSESEEEEEEEEKKKAGKGKKGKAVQKKEGAKNAAKGKAGKEEKDVEEEEEEGMPSCCIKRKAKEHHHHHHHHHHANGHGAHNHEHDDDDDDDLELGSDESDDDDDSDDDDAPLPGPVVPAAYAAIIAQVLTNTSETGVTIREIVGMVPHKDETEALNLANMLWTEGFASTVTAPVCCGTKKTAPATAAGKEEAAPTQGAAKKQKVAGGKKK